MWPQEVIKLVDRFAARFAARSASGNLTEDAAAVYLYDFLEEYERSGADITPAV